MGESARATALMTAMILILAVCATAFSLIFKRIGGQSMIEDAVGMVGTSPYVVVLVFLFPAIALWLPGKF